MSTKLLVGSLVLFCAIAISAIAAYFSVVGLAALFAAAFLPVAIMGIILEGSKLVAAGWLHSNWKNPNVTKPHKGYLTAAVCALMLITSMGIYGYLAKAHLEQKAPATAVQVQIDAHQGQLDQLTARKTELQTQQANINKTVDAYLASGKASGASTFMRQQQRERDRISNQIATLDTQINAKTAEMAPLKAEVAGVEAKLGPLKYVADLFGWKDPGSAVKLIILILMFAFDPLAVVLMISGTITLGEWAAERRRKTIDQGYNPMRIEEDYYGWSGTGSKAEPELTEIDDLAYFNKGTRSSNAFLNEEPWKSAMTLRDDLAAQVEAYEADPSSATDLTDMSREERREVLFGQPPYNDPMAQAAHLASIEWEIEKARRNAETVVEDFGGQPPVADAGSKVESFEELNDLGAGLRLPDDYLTFNPADGGAHVSKPFRDLDIPVEYAPETSAEGSAEEPVETPTEPLSDKAEEPVETSAETDAFPLLPSPAPKFGGVVEPITLEEAYNRAMAEPDPVGEFLTRTYGALGEDHTLEPETVEDTGEPADPYEELERISDRDILLAILEGNPRLIDDLVNAVDEVRAEKGIVQPKAKEWLEVKKPSKPSE